MKKIKNIEALKFAIDVPTGLNSETGFANDNCFQADYTITMFAPKTGLYLNDGLFYSGEIITAYLGVPDSILEPISNIFLLDENDKRKKIFVSSGTGLGPYISMIRQEIKDRGKCNCIIIHGVSHDYDLGYEKELNRYEKEGKIIKYIPTVSRKEENPEWKGEFGRAETLMEDRINKILNEKITKENYVIYACGHPGMIENIVKIFKLKGFIENKDIKFEKYWSQPKKITEQRIQIK